MKMISHFVWSVLVFLLIVGVGLVIVGVLDTFRGESQYAEAGTMDDVLYRRSVEAQVDTAKALKDIAEQMRKLVDKHDTTPVTCHGAKGAMEIQCPKGCTAEQCIKLFSCEGD